MFILEVYIVFGTPPLVTAARKASRALLSDAGRLGGLSVVLSPSST
jgi:hypothetical protein